MIAPIPITADKSIIGEGPLWVEQQQRLYWVDIAGAALYAFEPATSLRKKWPMPTEICWLIERKNSPGFIAGFHDGIAMLDVEPELHIEYIDSAKICTPNVRINDAKADAFGRIWTGTMGSGDRNVAVGALFKIDTDQSMHVADSGYHVCNGPAISCDGQILYNTDSYLRRIYAYDLTPDGKLENRRLWRQFAENEGYPDGMTIDSENCLWVAHWGGGRVSRFAPSGALLEAIPVPASQVTSCAFGGPDYRSLFITTASIGLEPKMLERDEPLAGSVFSVQVGVRGMPPATANL